MPSFDPAILLLQLGILLAVAFLLGRLAERIGLPATTGELATGLLLGPSVLGAVATARGRDWLFAPASGQNEFLYGIAAFCGVLLVGVAGATLDLGFIRTRLRTVGLISLGALGLPLVSTVALALAADPRLHGPEADMWTFAAYAGLALSVSAVPVIVKIFADLGVLHRNLSQLSLSVAVIDDAIVWIGLSIIAATVHLHHADDPAGNVTLTLAAIVALALLTVVARRTGVMAPPGAQREPGVGASCLVAAAFITLGAVITDGIGLDSTLGAFLCGAIVASGRIVSVVGLRPLRTVVLGVLAPLFLAVNGLAADLTALRDPRLALLAAAAVVLAVLSKTARCVRRRPAGRTRARCGDGGVLGAQRSRYGPARGRGRWAAPRAHHQRRIHHPRAGRPCHLGHGRPTDPPVPAADPRDSGRGPTRPPSRVTRVHSGRRSGPNRPVPLRSRPRRHPGSR